LRAGASNNNDHPQQKFQALKKSPSFTDFPFICHSNLKFVECRKLHFLI